MRGTSAGEFPAASSQRVRPRAPTPSLSTEAGASKPVKARLWPCFGPFLMRRSWQLFKSFPPLSLAAPRTNFERSATPTTFRVEGAILASRYVYHSVHTLDYGPFIKSHLTPSQLTREPAVVQVWSRPPPRIWGIPKYL